jgi:hypothetical protein
MAAQSVHCTTADGPDQTGCHEGAHDSLRPAPVQEPPPLASLVSRLGPPFCGRVQSLCDGCRGELLKFRIVLNFVLGALAHLQLGRAYAASGDVGKARVAYQDFFALWKDADPDIPILKEAKAEYAKLQ